MAENKTPTINKDLCIGCGACVAACPEGVLAMKEEKAMVANPEKCKQVKACVNVCPTGACIFN